MKKYFVHVELCETVEATSKKQAQAAVKEKLLVGGFKNYDIVEVRNTNAKD